MLIDLTVVIVFEADSLFGDAIGQDFLIEPLDAVKDAGEGEGMSVGIGLVGAKVGSHLAGAFHEFSANEGEVFDVGVFGVGRLVSFCRFRLLICGCRLILPPFCRRGESFFGGLAIWLRAQLLAPVAQRALGDTDSEVDIADMVADFEHLHGFLLLLIGVFAGHGVSLGLCFGIVVAGVARGVATGWSRKGPLTPAPSPTRGAR